MPCAERRGGSGLLLVSAAVPALCGLTPYELAAWTGAMCFGAALNAREPAGWVGLGWIAAILVPGTPPASVAAAGTLGVGVLPTALAALGGAAFAWLAPAAFAQPGPLLLAAGLLAAVWQARRPA